MSIEEWIDLCEHAQLMNADWTEREAKLAFIEAMMTQADEMKTRKHKEMSFVEFLEAVSWAACCLLLAGCMLGGWIPLCFILTHCLVRDSPLIQLGRVAHTWDHEEGVPLCDKLPALLELLVDLLDMPVDVFAHLGGLKS